MMWSDLCCNRMSLAAGSRIGRSKESREQAAGRVQPGDLEPGDSGGCGEERLDSGC